MSEKNKAYSERNRLAIATALLAIGLGYKAGRGIDDGHLDFGDEWRHVVYIEFPDGLQISYHMSPDEIESLNILPWFEGKWDGTSYGSDKDWLNKIVPIAVPSDYPKCFKNRPDSNCSCTGNSNEKCKECRIYVKSDGVKGSQK